MAGKRWAVCGPEIGTVVPVCDDGTGPMEYGRDYIEIEAATKREALVKGLRAFRRHEAEYQGNDDWWNDGGNPFNGMLANLLEPCEKHGYDSEACEVNDCWPDDAEGEAAG